VDYAQALAHIIREGRYFRVPRPSIAKLDVSKRSNNCVFTLRESVQV